jgi:hypothetical protein
MIRNTNDGSSLAPRLRVYFNSGTLNDLPLDSTGPRGSQQEVLEAIRAAGYEGVQGGDTKIARKLRLGTAGGGRIDSVAEAEEMGRWGKGEGHECATVHIGRGIEDDDVIDRLVGATIEASVKHDFPIYLETHRATITQDMWRTVKMAQRHPGLRFNADFSHWYTGLEMVYGPIEQKLEFIAPVLERCRFVHGRIGNPGSMQVDIGDGAGQAYVDHFREIWTRAFCGFLATAKRGDFITFAPELLQPAIFYARVFKNASGQFVEEGDRWHQALVYGRIARECFAEAERRMRAK